jgi:hypothetical protein
LKDVACSWGATGVILPTTRREALALGLPRFNTGQPCKHGHLADRYSKRSDCVVCRDLLFRRWYQRPENAEQVVASVREWRERNPDRARLNGVHARNVRRSREMNATPAWADLEAIKRIYAACLPGHEVDHVVPLGGKTVCGLHVPANLQYLPKLANRSKGAKFHA